MKYIIKHIGRREYKMQDHSKLVCIMCGGTHKITRRTRMNNYFQSEEYETSCQHCQTNKDNKIVVDTNNQF